MRRNNKRKTWIYSRQLFNDNGIFDVAQSGTAEFFRKNDAKKPYLPGLLNCLQRECLVLIPLGNMRSEFRGREFPDLLASDLEVVRRSIVAADQSLGSFWNY